MSDIRDEKKMPKILTEEEINCISGGAGGDYYFACVNFQIHFNSY